MLFRILLLGYSSLAAASGDTTFPVAHRFLPQPNPSGVEAAWAPFGSISLYPGSGGSSPNGSFRPGTKETQRDETAGSGWYQSSVDLGDGTSSITSVRACYLPSASRETIVLGVSKARGGIHPTSSYSDSGGAVGSDGACKERGQRVQSPSGQDVGVEIRFPPEPKGITLAPPPTLNPGTGKPAEPEVEKSFFQKYWLAILGVGSFVATQIAPEPPQQAGRPGAK